jgi:glycine/D-amino acid oxidase-like deaminating enzyme
VTATIDLHWPIPVREAHDVLVIGGGSAGIAAATAAARNGARTALVERYGFLGGTSTAGLVGPFMTSYGSDGDEPVVGGIFQEVVDRMVVAGGAIDPGKTQAGEKWASFITVGHAHVTPFHPDALKLAALDLVLEAGVVLMLHTSFVDVCLDGAQRRIEGVVVLTKAGLAYLPAAVVIDCSADGDVAARAGVPFSVGRDDGKRMPATMFFRIGDVDDARVEAFAREHEAQHPGEHLYECLVTAARTRGELHIPNDWINIYREPEPGVWRVNTTRLHDVDGTDPDDLTRAEIEGRRQVKHLLDFMRTRCPGLANVRLLEVAAQIGIRETRHVTGEYVLTREDVVTGARFPDAIARCAYPIDIHDPEGTRFSLAAVDAPYYEIPYRCLVPLRVDNLLVAGRCFSATHDAAASARVVPPIYAMGQAAGTAAALSVRGRVMPREFSASRLRQRLAEQGAIV